MEDSCFYVKWHGVKITCLLIIDLWLKLNICLLESVLRKTNDFFITLTILRIKYLKGVHVLGLQFATGFKFFRAASGWQEYLFAFNGWENASVFHRKKMHLAVFNDKYLRPYGCCDINSTATIKCSKIEIKEKSLKYK